MRPAGGFLAAGAALAWLAALALVARSPLPVSEARTLTVAWEMWLEGHWLVPNLNGLPYPDKPPLLFWTILAGWSVIGPSETWARLMVPLAGAGVLGAAAWIARLLWPDRGAVVGLVPVLLVAMPLFAVMATVVLFDVPLALLATLAMAGVVLAWRGRRLAGWTLFGAALGLGILTKGPVALVFALPVPLLAPWWTARGEAPAWPAWYAGLAAGLGLAAGIALAWALPAAKAGGAAYADAILWSQTAGRLTHSFAHAQPWWWYLPLLPLALFPWAWWPPMWRGIRALRADPGVRMLVVGFVVPLVVLSAISGKQPNYLVPLLPVAALLAARLLADAPAPRRWEALPALAPLAVAAILGIAVALTGASWLGARASPVVERLSLVPLVPLAFMLLLLLGTRGGMWRVAAGSLVAVAGAHLVFAHGIRDLYDPGPASRFVASAQAQGRAVAHLPEYEGHLGYAGRLALPLDVVDEPGLPAWAGAHPDGYVVTYPRPEAPLPAEPAFSQPFRGRTLAVWPATDVVRYGIRALKGE